MDNLSKLPVTVITGFLGSGKTTLIRHLMQNPGGKRLAIVVNEFGDVGVDGEILKSCAIPDCPGGSVVADTQEAAQSTIRSFAIQG